MRNSFAQSNEQLLNGVTEALCYSGFRSGQYPDRGDRAVNPSKEEILEDLFLMRDNLGTRLIRLYDCGENSQMVLQLIREHKLDMKVMLGIWLKAEISAHATCPWLHEPIRQDILDENKVLNQEEIQKGIELANAYPDVVNSVNVGNEALVNWNDHMVETESIISYVRNVKQEIDQPVTVADNYAWWAHHGLELAEVVDFVSIHIYPIWEGKGIDEALGYTIENVVQVRNALPDSQIVIAEAGWATIATEFGKRASEEGQLRYYKELMSWAKQNNITTFFFEAFDEDWKGNPHDMNGAEKHWGLFNVDRTPKKVVVELAKAEYAA